MRISPPVAGAMWRETDPTAGAAPVVIDGHVVPPGTQVGVCAYALHHDEAYFARPFEFDPSRWLPSPSTTGAEAQEEAERLRRMTSAFMPFLLGPRGCAGKAMAYLEAGLVVAKAVWRFDFDAAPGAPGAVGEGAPGRGPLRERPGEFQLYDTFGSRHDGPHLVFRERAGAAGGRV
ncbi:putative benzoate 4-monooxygenase cytochrome P450 protein [Rosellinia necatrix]|uniref:Putative benzoate 4-monooxygenase cytochrome P450 protein n=1 Tax=Rosellinia necatrix TaxID=77044 RepID=A0A1S8A9L8_ROSNE|nr:putative benzoate 4-monooxygenase cytochrome P450 protein [Rosellinia necatrix]